MNTLPIASGQSSAASSRRAHNLLLTLSVLAALTACSKEDVVGGSTKQVEDVPAPSDGFLPEPALLTRASGTLWTLTSMQPDLNFARYNAIYIAPVTVVTGPASQLATLPADQRYKLANTFYSELVTAVRQSCKVATRPGPGVVEFHVAISDATTSDGTVKTVATYAPYVSSAYKLGSFAFNNGVGYFSGTATAEAYAVDGATGALLWQGVDKRGGNVPIVSDTTNQWLDVDHAFHDWAATLVTKLQQTGICEAPATAPS